MSACIRSFILSGCLGLSLLSGVSCTARYQEMLRARDATIQDLETNLAKAGERNRALSEENARLRRRLEELQKSAAPVEASAPAKKQDRQVLADIERDLAASGLGDLKARYRHGRVSIGIPNRITFQPGSTRISSEGQRVLARLAKFLAKRPGKRIWIEGHTDSDPIRKSRKRFRSNRHLSVERADAVATWLIRHGGIPENRIVIVGFGPYDPISRTDKAKNRRVEIVLAD